MSRLVAILTALWAVLLFTGYFDKNEKDNKNNKE